MWIKTIKAKNYKGYKDCTVNLAPGINIVVGKNNAGKSALLELLSLRFNNVPHISFNQNPDFPVGGRSEVMLQAILKGTDLLRYSANSGGHRLALTTDPNADITKYHVDYLEHVRTHEYIEYKILRSATHGYESSDVPAIRLPHRANGGNYPCQVYNFNPNTQNFDHQGELNLNGDLGQNVLAGPLQSDIYYFKAERLNLSESPTGASSFLATDSANLPEVLGKLQEDRRRFGKYVEQVNKILPNIMDVRVEDIGGNKCKILVTGADPELGKKHLYFDLKECGTGIGQVLAIVYAVASQQRPCVIIVDEPNSFLHPEAARNLIEFFNRHPEHQYIISTHSPEVIAAANKKQLLIASWNGGECKIAEYDAQSVATSQACLLEIGARLSDVFGADKVCWVEGETERLCFPKILDSYHPAYKTEGTAFASIRSTGDLEGKTRQAFLDIYQRMSEGVALLPPTVHIIFDNETRNETERADLIRQSKGLLDFQPRRTYENYLIDAEAIAKVIKKNLPDIVITTEQLQQYIDTKRSLAAYYIGEVPDTASEQWLYKIDGARFLEDLFSSITDSKLKFSKTKHSVELTEWLVPNRAGHFNELADFLRRALKLVPEAQEQAA